MIRILIIAIVATLFVSTASAQTPSAPPAPPKPVTYTLTPDQAATLKRGLALGDFWLQVRIAAAGNTADGHGFELQRQELMGLAQVLQQQEQAAAKPQEKPGEPDAVADPPKN